MDVLICEDLEAPPIQNLSRKYSLCREPGASKNSELLIQRVREARTIMIRNQTQLTAEVFKAAPALLAVGRVGVGLDNIDMEAATQAGVVVIAPLNANATSVAELTLGLMLALARKIPLADRSTKSGAWDRKSATGIELDGKTLAICGFGRIGKLVAARARAFGMRLSVYDPYVNAQSSGLAEMGAGLSPTLEETVTAADFVSIHLPLTSQTKHLFNAQVFGKMKPGAFLINTSRGGVIDEGALVASLRLQHLAGAALDVREIEPPTRSQFDAMENVVLTPHIGAFTLEAQARTFDAVCQDLDRILSGEAALNFVNMARPQKNKFLSLPLFSSPVIRYNPSKHS